MKILHFYILLLMCSIFSGCENDVALRKETSILELLVSPETLNGEIIIVKGFLGDKNGRAALYLSKEDAIIHNNKLAIILYETNRDEIIDSCGWAYVSLIGRFSHLKNGLGYVLDEVSSVTRLNTNELTYQEQICFVSRNSGDKNSGDTHKSPPVNGTS